MKPIIDTDLYLGPIETPGVCFWRSLEAQPHIPGSITQCGSLMVWQPDLEIHLPAFNFHCWLSVDGAIADSYTGLRLGIGLNPHEEKQLAYLPGVLDLAVVERLPIDMQQIFMQSAPQKIVVSLR